jgi:hypothetical protein
LTDFNLVLEYNTKEKEMGHIHISSSKAGIAIISMSGFTEILVLEEKGPETFIIECIKEPKIEFPILCEKRTGPGKNQPGMRISSPRHR